MEHCAASSIYSALDGKHSLYLFTVEWKVYIRAQAFLKCVFLISLAITLNYWYTRKVEKCYCNKIKLTY